MKRISEKVFNSADRVASASKGLNYQRIIAHDKAEVDKLNKVLRDLDIDRGDRDGVTHSDRGATRSPDMSLSAVRRKQMEERFEQEGFGDRLNRVYNSFAKDRTISIKQIPHSRGLPPYDMVVAPDFAPVAGLHGIFISGNQVMSIILPSETQAFGEWHIVKQKSFSTIEDMIEVVTLVAAGFDLP